MRLWFTLLLLFHMSWAAGCADSQECESEDCLEDTSSQQSGETETTEPGTSTEDPEPTNEDEPLCDETHADWTVGLQSCTQGVQAGYTLFSPMRATSTFLIDAWGEQVHSWESTYKPGLSVYLEADGSLLRATSVPRNTHGAHFDTGGLGGRVENVSWDSELIWSFQYASTEHIAHHDIERLPNGNVLMIAFEVKSEAEAIAAGRDPSLINDGELWPDHIIEVRPEGTDGGEIVWEWHFWDHMIQDFDETKENFGVVAEHPELMDINYVGNGRGAGGADWLHVNSIDYNAELDQILLSAHNTSEILVIDHSTTTEEAAGSAGDILYRWGNPAVYGRGGPGEQALFVQHDAHWIAQGLVGAGNILIFNNGGGRDGGDHTTIDEIVPPYDGAGGYAPLDGNAHGPSAPVWQHGTEEDERFYSRNISGSQRLANGNTLICDGPAGRFIEVQQDGTLVWEYINPVIDTGVVVQGESVPSGQNGQANTVFRATRVPMDHPGLIGRDLTPTGYIEASP